MPDLTDWAALESWIADRLRLIADWRILPGVRDSFCSLAAGEASACPDGPCERYVQQGWRRFAIAAFLADWACYPQPEDRDDFAKMLFALHQFPAGFRVWWMKHSGAGWLPAGYTAWHPIDEMMYERLERASPPMKDRLLLPLSSIDPGQGYIYLYNVSVLPQLRGSLQAGLALTRLLLEIKTIQPRGLAMITVSPDGVRLAKRLGLRPAGEIRLKSTVDTIYTGRV